MTTPMDREFGDDPLRKMGRKKMARMAGIPESAEKTPDLEASG